MLNHFVRENHQMASFQLLSLVSSMILFVSEYVRCTLYNLYQSDRSYSWNQYVLRVATDLTMKHIFRILIIETTDAYLAERAPMLKPM